MNTNSEKWIDYARYSLYFCGACYFLLALLGAPMFFGIALSDGMQEEEAIVFGLIFGVFMFVICAAVGVMNILVANNLAKRKKWAWIGGIAFGVLYVGSACFPFGALLLYAMFQNQQAFETKS